MDCCKSCNNCDLIDNICLIDGTKCYENKVCLRGNCHQYSPGHWQTNEDEHHYIPKANDMFSRSEIINVLRAWAKKARNSDDPDPYRRTRGDTFYEASLIFEDLPRKECLYEKEVIDSIVNDNGS